MVSNLFIKLFKLEYYFDKPLRIFELPYSELIGRTYSRLPVIRCFGSSPSGQKICAHIHGVLPYLFIEDHSIASCVDGAELRNNLRTLVRRIETVLSSRSIYGFRDSDSTFLKIYLTDPADVPILAELLLSGAALGFPVQPLEVHIPYLLQFCADYNLQGMNYLEATAFRVRDIKTRKTLSNNDSSNPLTFIMSQDGSLGRRSSAQRQTSTDVEVDISACDILNRLELQEDAESLNAGLDFLWTEERMRREALMKTGVINETFMEMPTVDELLPLSNRPGAVPVANELDQIGGFNRLVQELSSSQLEGGQYIENTQRQSLGLSQRTLNDLCKLAEASEEYDARLPSSFASSLSAFLNASHSVPKATSEWLPSVHQSQSEDDSGAALLDSAKASVSTLLYPDEVNGIDGNGMVENAEEQQDDDLFASILESSVTSEPENGKEGHSENEDLFPSFIENLVENSTESESTSATARVSTSFHLPQVDGVDDLRDKQVHQRPRKRRLGLRLTPGHLATPETIYSSFGAGDTALSAPLSASIANTPEVNLSTPPSPLPPPKFSTPLRERRGDMTYIFDNDDSKTEEDIDSSLVLRFPPEATQVLEEEEEKGEKLIEPLPCHLGDTDFALHSSVYLTLRDPPAPPSYSQVEAEMRLREADPPQPTTVSPPSVDKREIDLSTSLSIIWSQEQQQKRMGSCSSNARVLSPLSSSSSNPISRRAFLPVQEDHCTLASLEVLCHTRRQTGAPTTIQRTSHAISISSLGGFFAPDPQFDRIVAASLAFSSFSASPTFLLVIVEPQKPPLPPPIPHQRSTPPALIICNTEIDLFNWIVYLVQSFDPDILLGYDVERWSWNYAVQRAARIGRVGFLRDISRLAPERLNCPSCLDCMSKCSGLLPGDRLVTSSVSSSCSCDSRTRSSFSAWPCEPGRGRSDAPFACPGRLVFSLWHLLKHEVSLHEYSFETVVLHVLKKRMPKFTQGQLSDWMDDVRSTTRWQALLHVNMRSETNLTLLKRLDLIARTSEFARVFGIEFFHVLSRGSQYRVESLLLRTARRLNFLLPSPSPPQRAHQRAPQAIPLTLEPYSGLHADAPVVVLDFQSLYPSVAIAHNYCFSTAVGRLRVLQPDETFEFGCLTHSISAKTLKKLANRVTVSPNGVVFVRPEVYRGVLPRLWRGLLSSRLMVKDSLKIYAQHSESLKQLLDARQLGLKLIANVMYGYTAASFSGRMPCVEVCDSIVHKGRECLERAIRLVEGDAACQMPWTGSKVIYGDTDSLFVKLPPSVDKETAFKLGQQIADAVTASNPAPIKLKLEKVYYPCVLETKKRYVGYAYESPSQTEPKFDAKGIETVRRDHAPFVGTILESAIRQIFDAFQWNNDPLDVLPKVEPKVRECVRTLARDLNAGKVPLSACLLTRPYRGPEAYRPGVCAPALQVARRLKSVDPAREPSIGERVAYYLTSPPTPNSPLIGCVKAAEEAQHYDIQPPLHLVFYLEHQLLPPLRRVGDLLGWRVDSWLSDIPRRVVRFKEMEKVDGLIQHESPGSRRGRRRWVGQQGASAMMHEFLSLRRCCLACGGDSGVAKGSICCASCLSLDPLISTKVLVRHGIELKMVQVNLQQSMDLCDACVKVSNCSNRRQPCGIRSTPSPSQACVNIDCPNLQSRQRLLVHLRRLQRAITEVFHD
ncbi:DNA polymerase zeta catalytic subunit [Echinococcus granulosus]|uniref:DNA polymerase n=1 Tax=Echinococcus granulosus TaxID=6210 RepID=A0A068WX47_ECHGR|nr:DNA polymerase zeta catalytic subunit [Echinococcus granulosus]CDS24390.1 DNA polymerase zeta catalytic subunit [Echinococcus granulosus]